MRNSVFKMLTVALFVFMAMNSLAAEDTQANKINAKALLDNAQRAVGQVVRAAQANPQLKGGGSKSKPFWDAMKQINVSLDKAQTGLALKDDTFFNHLASARAQVYQAEVAISMTGGGDTALNSSMKTLSGVITRLDEGYSKDAVRARSDEKLTATEEKQLDKLIAQQADLMKKLDQVERNAARNSKEMRAGIKKIREQSKQLKRARNRASAFHSARIMSSWMWAWHWWWGPWGVWCPGWIDINIIIWDDWLDVVDYDWAMIDYVVDVDDLALDSLDDISDAELSDADDYLEDNDFSLDDGDLQSITSDMDLGWGAVESDSGHEVMDSYEDNFDSVPFERDFEPSTFDSYGMDDFGGGFDDFGGDF